MFITDQHETKLRIIKVCAKILDIKHHKKKKKKKKKKHTHIVKQNNAHLEKKANGPFMPRDAEVHQISTLASSRLSERQQPAHVPCTISQVCCVLLDFTWVPSFELKGWRLKCRQMDSIALSEARVPQYPNVLQGPPKSHGWSSLINRWSPIAAYFLGAEIALPRRWNSVRCCAPSKMMTWLALPVASPKL